MGWPRIKEADGLEELDSGQVAEEREAGFGQRPGEVGRDASAVSPSELGGIGQGTGWCCPAYSLPILSPSYLSRASQFTEETEAQACSGAYRAHAVGGSNSNLISFLHPAKCSGRTGDMGQLEQPDFF